MKYKVELIIDVSERQLEDGHIYHWDWTEVIGLGSDAVVLDSRCEETEDVELETEYFKPSDFDGQLR